MKKTNIIFWEEMLKDAPAPYQQWFAKEKEYLRRIIKPNSRVLDVGCGDGRSIFDVLPVTKNVVGVDHDERAVVGARKNFVDCPSVEFLEASAAAMPFGDSNFDFIICMGTFANFADEKVAVLKEMRRVLKSSGKIIISVYSEDAFEERMRLYKSSSAKIREVRGTTVIFDESMGDNTSEQFSEQELRSIFNQAGLKTEDITKVGIGYLCTLSK